MNNDLEAEFHVEPLPRNYSNQELKAFWDWLDKFKEEKEVRLRVSEKSLLGEILAGLLKEFNIVKKEKVSIVNLYEAMVSFGAMRKKYGNYSVIVECEGDRSGKPIYKSPNKYEIFMDKYEQASKLHAKQEYAKGEELKAYEQMAQHV